MDSLKNNFGLVLVHWTGLGGSRKPDFDFASLSHTLDKGAHSTGGESYILNVIEGDTFQYITWEWHYSWEFVELWQIRGMFSKGGGVANRKDWS